MIRFEPSSHPAAFGHHFFVGLSGSVLTDTDKRMLSALHPAGIVLFQRNFTQNVDESRWRKELARLLYDTKQYAEQTDLFVSIDHEGGRVHRVPSPLTPFPYARAYRHAVREVAHAMALELRSIGVNLNWAPVADVSWNDQNPVIGERAFGETAAAVIDPAMAFAETLLANGILCCAKHFPGHGGTSVDSHKTLPTVLAEKAILEAQDMEPFRKLAALPIPFIMSAHVLYPALDAVWPATLSEQILKRYLRDSLRFEGVVVSDDLDMGAITKLFAQEETIVRALGAGCDAFIVSKDTPRAVQLAEHLGAALRDRRISESALFASFQRIERALHRAQQHPVTALADNLVVQHQELLRSIA